MTYKAIYVLNVHTADRKITKAILFEDFADAMEEKQSWEAEGLVCWIESHVLNKKTKRKAA